MGMTERRKEFDGLRFILAICVMLWHSRVYVEQILPLKIYIFRGEIANVIFFMLSGFFITFNKKIYVNNVNEYFRFVYNKIKTIYPLYFASLIYISILYWKKNFLIANPKLLIRHIFLIQSWPIHNNASAEFNGPMWFLSCLLFCWIITPFILKINIKKRLYPLVVFLAIAFIVESLLSIDCNGIWKIWPTVAYLVGMVIGDVWVQFHVKSSKRREIIGFFILGLLFLIAEIACIAKWQYGMTYLILIIFACYLIVYILFMPESTIAKILRSNILSNGGAYTMNIFVIHSPIMYTYDRIDLLKSMPLLWLALVFGTTIVLSVILKELGKYMHYKINIRRGKFLK